MITPRWKRFNETTGALGYCSKLGLTGANLHPDRCVCQGSDTTPHKHYQDEPHRCARCRHCQQYRPAEPMTIDAIRKELGLQ